MEVRNETIVKLLETLGGIIENRHTGISTMQDKMKEANKQHFTGTRGEVAGMGYEPCKRCNP